MAMALTPAPIAMPIAETTHRAASLPFRMTTALFGHAGIEWDITRADEGEREALRRWAALYRELRPLLHSGVTVRSDEVDDQTLLHGVVAADGSRAIDLHIRGLEKMGADIGEVSLPTFEYGIDAYYLIAPSEASANLARYDGVRYGLRVDSSDVATMNARTRAAGFGAEVKRRIMLGTYSLSAGYYDAYYGKAQRVRTVLARDFAAAYESFDVLLSPTSPTTAFRLGDKTDDPMAMYLNDVCTIPSNLAGHPAMSVPFGTAGDGLPVGVQVLAPALREVTMFRVAAALEAAAPQPAGAA